MESLSFCQPLGLVLTSKKSQGLYTVTVDLLPELHRGSKSHHIGALNQHK